MTFDVVIQKFDDYFTQKKNITKGSVGQNEYGGAKKVTGNFYLHVKSWRTHGDKIDTLFLNWNRRSKTDDPVIISS